MLVDAAMEAAEITPADRADLVEGLTRGGFLVADPLPGCVQAHPDYVGFLRAVVQALRRCGPSAVTGTVEPRTAAWIAAEMLYDRHAPTAWQVATALEVLIAQGVVAPVRTDMGACYVLAPGDGQG